MRHSKILLSAASLAATLALAAAPAVAAPAPLSVQVSPPSAARVHHARAFLRLDLGRKKAWLGQAIPITISAQFRAVEGVTLEGLPQLKSERIFTSDIARDPRQSTQIVDGEPVLVATWTGTITPSTAGPLTLSVELPVRIRYHEAAPRSVVREPQQDPNQDEDPFQGMMNVDPFDPTSIQRMFQSMQRSLPMGFDEPLQGAAHDDALTLKANAHPLEIQALPVLGQPPTFNGAVGHFDLRASLSNDQGSANDPLTLTVTVKGDGDLDRVELAGVASSADFKAYPMSAKSEAVAPAKKLGQKTFEQVLIPTHGGALTIPAIELAVFDPISGHYTSVSTAPITVLVAGPAAPPAAASVPSASMQAPRARAAEDAPPSSLPAPPPSSLVDNPRTIALRLSPLLGLLLVAALARFGLRRDPEKALHRALRRSAKQGSASAFFEAARRLIVMHFSRRWGVAEGEITPDALRAQLGNQAEPLVQAFSTSDALRFGRRSVERVELRALCSSIEESLKHAA